MSIVIEISRPRNDKCRALFARNICLVLFAFATSGTIVSGEEPESDPAVPGWLRVRFNREIKHDAADATLSGYGLSVTSSSGKQASPQWRRIKIKPFTEDEVANRLRGDKDIADVRAVKVSELYLNDRGVSLQTTVTRSEMQPANTKELQANGKAYVDGIQAKLVDRFKGAVKVLSAEECSLNCRIKLDGTISQNPQVKEVVDCVFILVDSKLILIADGYQYNKKYDPTPATEVVKPLINELKPALGDFAGELLQLARSAFPPVKKHE